MKANRLFTMFLAVALFCSCLAIPASARAPEYAKANYVVNVYQSVPTIGNLTYSIVVCILDKNDEMGVNSYQLCSNGVVYIWGFVQKCARDIDAVGFLGSANTNAFTIIQL